MPEMPTASDVFDVIDGDDADLLDALLAESPGLAASRDDEGVSAVLHSLYHGRPSLAAKLAAALPRLDVFEAAALGRADRVRELLAAEPDLARAQSPDGFTALHLPAFFGGEGTADATRALIEAGADLNARSDNSFWVLPLHSAAAGGHAEIVEILLAAGAAPDERQRHGWTALHAAAQNGDLRSLEALLAAGADPTLRNDDGLSAADLATAGGHEELVARLG
ncbi:MAG TPA: ankyrin repeat domain-containing protein [Candidatus Limnocylindrales bacterium]|nr:ankyrin repeat domain-containing protein [Candidatus Limnocylindrales bacterium]